VRRPRRSPPGRRGSRRRRPASGKSNGGPRGRRRSRRTSEFQAPESQTAKRPGRGAWRVSFSLSSTQAQRPLEQGGGVGVTGRQAPQPARDPERQRAEVLEPAELLKCRVKPLLQRREFRLRLVKSPQQRLLLKLPFLQRLVGPGELRVDILKCL